jgi:ribosomal subunit interface protein
MARPSTTHIPMEIQFRGMDPSPAMEAVIREKLAKLDQYHPNIGGCRVVIEKPHHHKHQGEHFVVTLDVSVPGNDIVANHCHNEDAHVAFRDAYQAAKRQLEAHSRKLRGDVKAHSRPQANGAAVADEDDA